MKQSKQKILLCCMPIVAVLCSIVFMLSGCFIRHIHTIEEVAQELADDWGIHLPEDAKLLYCLHCSDWTEGERYYVISFEKTPALIGAFSYETNDSIMSEFDYYLAHMSEEERTEIPTEYRPDSEADYLSRSIQKPHGVMYDDLYLLYYPENLELYVIISYA